MSKYGLNVKMAFHNYLQSISLGKAKCEIFHNDTFRFMRSTSLEDILITSCNIQTLSYNIHRLKEQIEHKVIVTALIWFQLSND